MGKKRRNSEISEFVAIFLAAGVESCFPILFAYLPDVTVKGQTSEGNYLFDPWNNEERLFISDNIKVIPLDETEVLETKGLSMGLLIG